MATPFTQASLSRLSGKQGERQVVHDSRTPGLRAELREGGKVTFYLFKRLPGSGPIRVRLGGFPELTVDDARRQAADALGEIAKGRNPADANRLRREEATVGDLFTHWIENHAKLHKKTWEEDKRQYDSYLADWRNRKLSHVTQADVQSLHAKLGQKHGHYTANRVLSLLRAAFNKARELGYRGENPATGVKRFKETSRDRFLQPEELPRFFAAIKEEPNECLRDFFLLALFTGARRSNVCEMKWSEIDFERAEWRIPETKAGRSQVVYLPEPAIRLLEARKADSNKKSPWVLPGDGKTGHLTDPKMAWKRLLTRAGIENLRIHDLRRTLGSYQAIQGASLAIIGASLGHSQSQTTQVYARLTSNAVAESVGRAAGFIESAGRFWGIGASIRLVREIQGKPNKVSKSRDGRQKWEYGADTVFVSSHSRKVIGWSNPSGSLRVEFLPDHHESMKSVKPPVANVEVRIGSSKLEAYSALGAPQSVMLDQGGGGELWRFSTTELAFDCSTRLVTSLSDINHNL